MAQVLSSAGKLGLTSFGGPTAHIGYFRREYVERRRWLSEAEFAELVGLCHVLPGPASSQLGVAIGMIRARLLGALAAWLAFTAPSAAIMIGFALLIRESDIADAGWVHGLKLAAVAVVAHAVIMMWRMLAPDLRRSTVVLASIVGALLWPGAGSQAAIIGSSAFVGWLLYRRREPDTSDGPAVSRGRTGVGAVALGLFVVLLVALPLLARSTTSHSVVLADSMYRSGALVFGGGHVVLPLLNSETVVEGWVSQQDFVAGYGAAQAIPGPLFTFAGYLGAVGELSPNGITGGLLAIVAIFLPGLLLLIGVLPMWNALRARAGFRAALVGVGAAVVGLLAAALYRPLATDAITGLPEIAIALLGLGLLARRRTSPLVVVVASALAGQLLL